MCMLKIYLHKRQCKSPFHRRERKLQKLVNLNIVFLRINFGVLTREGDKYRQAAPVVHLKVGMLPQAVRYRCSPNLFVLCHHLQTQKFSLE